jgi:hypothetical protein
MDFAGPDPRNISSVSGKTRQIVNGGGAFIRAAFALDSNWNATWLYEANQIGIRHLIVVLDLFAYLCCFEGSLDRPEILSQYPSIAI